MKPRVIVRISSHGWRSASPKEASAAISNASISTSFGIFTTKAQPPGHRLEKPVEFAEPSGSNGIAIAPSNTVAHHALLLINPHTSFFFRSELQMVSDEGLDAYGAVTWGQFFIYQGFNDRAGWMHTTSGVDAMDEYLETVVKKGDRFYYKYGKEERPLDAEEIVVPYKTSTGWRKRNSPSTGRITARSFVRPTASG